MSAIQVSRMLTCQLVLMAGLALSAMGAQAAEIAGAEIKALISGNTVYLALVPGGPAGGGDGAIFYNTDGTATFKTPAGPIWHGTWQVKDNQLCVDWKELPNNPCTRYEKDGAETVLINTATGKQRGKLVRVAPDNPEKL